MFDKMQKENIITLQPTEEHLGHFQVRAVVNKATSNIPVQILS